MSRIAVFGRSSRHKKRTKSMTQIFHTRPTPCATGCRPTPGGDRRLDPGQVGNPAVARGAAGRRRTSRGDGRDGVRARNLACLCDTGDGGDRRNNGAGRARCDDRDPVGEVRGAGCRGLLAWEDPRMGNRASPFWADVVMALMRAAPNWDNLKRNLQRAFPKLNETIPLPFAC